MLKLFSENMFENIFRYRATKTNERIPIQAIYKMDKGIVRVDATIGEKAAAERCIQQFSKYEQNKHNIRVMESPQCEMFIRPGAQL